MKHTKNIFDTVTGEIFPAKEINIRLHDYPRRIFLTVECGTTPLFSIENKYFRYLKNNTFIKVSMKDTVVGKYPSARKYVPEHELAIDIAYMKHNNCMDSGIVHEQCYLCPMFDPMSDITCICKPARDEYIIEQLLKEKLDAAKCSESIIKSHHLQEEELKLHMEDIDLKRVKAKHDYEMRKNNAQSSSTCMDNVITDTQDIGYGTLRSRPEKKQKNKKPFWKIW